MTKQKQPKPLNVAVNFTPVADWDARLKKVMELLLHPRKNDGKERENDEQR